MADNSKAAEKVYETQESLYAKAVDVMAADRLIVQFAFRIENYLKAAQMFEEVGDYEDAPLLAENCRRLAKEEKAKEKEYLYQRAVELKNSAVTAGEYEKAAEAFLKVPGYDKDGKERAEALEMMKQLQRKNRIRRGIKAGILLACVAAVAAFFLSPQWPPIYEKLMKKTMAVATPESVQAGETLRFGACEWYVLEKTEDRELLIMNKAEEQEALRNAHYHEADTEVTWEESDLRSWLNSVFLEENFNEEERSRLLPQHLIAAGNEVWGTDGGADTEDLVSIPDIAQVTAYHDIMRNIKLTMWMRNPGHSQNTAVFMTPNTAVMDYGYIVNGEGLYCCPVICVSLNTQK